MPQVMKTSRNSPRASKSAQMTMAATIWLSKNRPDLPPETSLRLASMLGEVAESENWIAPAADYDENAPKSNDEIQAFLDGGEKMFHSVTRATGYDELLAATLGSIANFMGWKVPA